MLKPRTLRAKIARAALAASALGLTAAAAAAPAGAAEAPCAIAPGGVGAATVVSCGFTGGAQSWTVPPGVTEATFDLYGAQGGTSQLSAGGLGARAQATLPVTPGDVYELRVGGVGSQASSCSHAGAGGWNGGGIAGTACDPGWLYRYQGLGGGGATDARLGGSALADRVLIAAGGGGAAHFQEAEGGAGGAPDGQDGGVLAGDAHGRGATQLAGGVGPVIVEVGSASGFDGELGVGGTGGGRATGGGGGGGGGLYGGSGGGARLCVGGCGGDGGGGGGSSWGPPGTTYAAGAQSGAGRARITYTTVNPAPACQPDSGETGGGRQLALTLSCTDASGADFSYELVAGPGKGTLGAIDQATGDVTYTPNPGQSGSDTFSYRATGVNGPSATATVTITLHPPPACEPGATPTGHDVAVTIELDCAEADGEELTYAIATPPADGTLGAIDQDAATVLYTPDAGFAGADAFTYTATSVNGTSQARTVEVAVDPLPPTCAPRTETTPAVTSLAITLSCAGTAGFPTSYAIVAQPQHGAILSVDAATGAVTYLGAIGYAGPDSFSYRATNAGGASTTETVSIDVSAPPAPSCAPARATLGEDAGSVVLQLSCTSTDGFAVTYATTADPDHGTLSALDPVAGTVTYTPDDGFGGTDSFSFTGTNTGGASAPADAQVTVLAPPAFDGVPAEGAAVTSARPVLAFAGGVALDGFECRADDGAWSACASPFTVPDALERGEHAVAVRSRGDGGERSRAVTRSFVVDGVSEAVAPGGTLSSDVGGRGPGAGNPLEVALTSPAAGQVTLRELAAGAVVAPAGHELYGRGFDVTAPAAPDAEQPLRIELQLDAAIVPADVALDQLIAFRDGAPVAAACSVADRLGPVPCIATRNQAGGTVTLVVLSDHASTWAVGRALPVPPEEPPPGGGGGGNPPGGGGGGGTPPDGGGGGRPEPTPVPSNRFAFPRVTVTRAGGLVARFAFPRAGSAVLVGTAARARTPFTAAGALNRRSTAARQALFTVRTVRSPRARTVTVRLAPTARGRALLRRDGRLTARLWVSFRPTGGTARAASRRVLVTLRAARR